jgi:hypothetical protein
MLIWGLAISTLVLCGSAMALRWGMRWGSTSEERHRQMPGDEYLDSCATVRVAMTRAVSIDASAARVWPWIAQLGRGAGWYSVDWLDNGRRSSAWHVLSWVPEPRLGDATAIGYLRHLEKGQAMAWWVDGVQFFGARACLVTAYCLESKGSGTRLVSRMSATTTGFGATASMLVFRVIDSFMATRQLIGLRDRIESSQDNRSRPGDPETGERDQYQLCAVLYAAGGSAGVVGKEHAERWRRSAIDDGVIPDDS